MSLEKAIASGKEHRQPYRGSASFDPACRHQHGSTPCSWCAGNRTIQTRRADAGDRADRNAEIRLDPKLGICEICGDSTASARVVRCDAHLQECRD